jgi:hypothetical protein
MVPENEEVRGSAMVLWLIVLVVAAAAFGYSLGLDSGQQRSSRRVEDQLDVMMHHLSAADRPAGDAEAADKPAAAPKAIGAGDAANATGPRGTAMIDS